MSNQVADYLFVALLVLLATIFHTWFTHFAISYFPVSIFLALMLPWVVNNPQRYLIALVVVSELLTTLPVGIMTLAIFTPLLLKKLFSRVSVDLSFSFFALVIFSSLLEVLVLISYDLWSVYISEMLDVTAVVTQFPSRVVIISVLIMALVAYVIAILRTFILPKSLSLQSQ